jgi:large subunit ribosomal protein L19
MPDLIAEVEAKYKKKAVVAVRSGDTVKVSQKVREGSKERVQVFEGLVIKVSRPNSHTYSFTVRRIASGIGVEKTFWINHPSILKVEVIKRAKVRRNYLTYMRQLTGKSARLMGVDFDKEKVNVIHDEAAEAEEAKIKEEQAVNYDPEAAKAEKAAEKAEAEAGQKEEPKKEVEAKKPDPKS